MSSFLANIHQGATDYEPEAPLLGPLPDDFPLVATLVIDVDELVRIKAEVRITPLQQQQQPTRCRGRLNNKEIIMAQSR